MVHAKSWNLPKRGETTQNNPKVPETTHFYYETTRNHRLFFKTQIKPANRIFVRTLLVSCHLLGPI